MRLRPAVPADAAAVAALHADSWRRHYRGAYTDAFLDGDVAADRLAVWSGRLASPEPGAHTLLAEDGGGLLGFAHVVLGSDPDWGALVDNLHVTYARKRTGVGTRLLEQVGRVVTDGAPDPRLYLWVLEQNVDAQAFYRARGGRVVGRRDVSGPGGDPALVVGTPVALRMAWADAGLPGGRTGEDTQGPHVGS